MIYDDHITGIANILENPYLTNISMTNIINILEILYLKLEKLNEQDIIQNPKNNSFISLLKGMARIFNSISDMSTDINIMIVKEQFHNKLKEKLSELVKSHENYPLVNFYANYCLQSLLRISNGVSLFEGIFKKKKFTFGIINVAQFYFNTNPAKLYDSYINFKEAFTFDFLESWFDHCRQMEILIKTGNFYYLKAEIHQKFEENEIDYFYLYYIILELNKEYNKIIEYLKIQKFRDNNKNDIDNHHNSLIKLFDLLLNNIIRNKDIVNNNKNCLIELIVNFFL